MQNIEFIIIGNELLNGKIKDLNTHSLTKALIKVGLKLSRVHIIPDNKAAFTECLSESTKRSSVVIMSGGLGPTKDDITKSMLANFFKKEICFSKEALTLAKLHYERGGREFDQEKIDYQNIPKDFSPLLNPIGYAPGLLYEQENLITFATPGVPSEFSAMVSQEIIPQILKKFPIKKKLKNVIIKTWKIPEAKIFTELCPNLWQQLEEFGEVSSLPHFFGVDIGIQISAENDHEFSIIEENILKTIKNSAVDEFVWQIGGKSLEEFIVQAASKKNIKFGFAESCTGGQCAGLITDVAGASKVFWGSIISYSNDVKIKTLGVAEQTLIEHGAVSLPTAKEMALGARNELAVDIAITTTGIAGPGGGSAEKPVGMVAIGVSTKSSNTSKVYNFQGNRESLKNKFTHFALMTLLEEIINFE